MEIKDEKIKNWRQKWIFGTKLKNCPVINPVAAEWIVTGLTTADFQRVMSWNIKARGWQEKINWQKVLPSKGYPKKTIRSSAQIFGEERLKITTALALQTLSKTLKT